MSQMNGSKDVSDHSVFLPGDFTTTTTTTTTTAWPRRWKNKRLGYAVHLTVWRSLRTTSASDINDSNNSNNSNNNNINSNNNDNDDTIEEAAQKIGTRNKVSNYNQKKTMTNKLSIRIEKKSCREKKNCSFSFDWFLFDTKFVRDLTGAQNVINSSFFFFVCESKFQHNFP